MSLSPADLPVPLLDRIVTTAIEEDLAAGDATTRAVVPPDAIARGRVIAREPITVAGLPVVERVFALIDGRVAVRTEARDGQHVAAKTPLAHIEGPAHAVLAGERVALNLLQRMCGVATRTQLFVAKLPAGSGTRIADTRKTTPGLRLIERYAVRCGGGHNHRNDLGAGLLIKDNHIAVCGGVRAAIERARATAPHTMRVEIEVETLEQLDEALDATTDVVLLDNFDDARITQAMQRVRAARKPPIVEVSGGVGIDRIEALTKLGVDVVSVGSLTHGSRAMDIGLDLDVKGSWT